MLELYSLQPMKGEDIESYTVRFSLFGETPPFLSAQLARDDGETLDDVVSNAREKVKTAVLQEIG